MFEGIPCPGEAAGVNVQDEVSDMAVELGSSDDAPPPTPKPSPERAEPDLAGARALITGFVRWQMSGQKEMPAVLAGAVPDGMGVVDYIKELQKLVSCAMRD